VGIEIGIREKGEGKYLEDSVFFFSWSLSAWVALVSMTGPGV
jgi:hypothetical protein